MHFMPRNTAGNNFLKVLDIGLNAVLFRGKAFEGDS
jgi:hypothetical protein